MLRLLAGVLALAAVAAAQTSVVGEGGGAADLGALTDVTITTATTDDVLSYDGSAWVNTKILTLQLPFAVQTSGGQNRLHVRTDGDVEIGLNLRHGGNRWFFGSYVGLSSTTPIGFSSTSSPFSPTHDVGLARSGIGELRVTDGSTSGPSRALLVGDLRVYDDTATTGVTTAVVKAGAGQSTTDLMQWQDNAGNVLGRIASDGYGKLPAVQLVDPGAKPSCTSDTRGMIWYDAGGAGVADTAEICGKDAADAYAWVAIATF